MRKIILSMQMSLDGFIEGPNGDMDWFSTDDDDQWKDMFQMLRTADTFLLGRAMYPGYADYWRSMLTDKAAPANKLAFARLAETTQHIVFSKTMKKADWKNTHIASGGLATEISNLKKLPGKDMVVWGGAALASSLIKLGLIDEYRIVVNPVLLGGGKVLFKEVRRQTLALTETKRFTSGAVALHYKSLHQ